MKLGTSTECLLGTLEPSATLPLLETPFLNLYLELSLGTSELGTSWNFETFRNLSLEALVAWNLHLKPDFETLEPSKPVLGTRVFVDLLDPSLATWNLETLPGTLTENLPTPWGLYLESLLGVLEPSELYLRTFAGNLDRHLEPSRTYTLTWMEPMCFTWNLGIFPNLYLEPLLETSAPSGTLYDWNPYLEPRNLPEPLLGTLILGTSEPSYLEPLLGTSEPAGTFTWNPYTWNLGTFGTLLGTLTWNLGTCRNLYLEPLLGTSEPARTWRDDCPRVPQGLVWLGPQSFQLLGKKNKPMLNPISYAIITGKNQWGIQTDRDLQGTLT